MLTIAALVVCTLALLAGSAAFGAVLSGPQHRIVGVALGVYGSDTRMPRQALTCTNTSSTETAEVCRASIDGAELTIEVEYQESGNLRFGRCSASYHDTVADCWAVWYTVTGPRLYAHVPTVAPGMLHATTQWLGIRRVQEYDAPHLEISPEALAAIRRQYPLDNFLEREWMLVIQTLAFLATATMFVLALLLPRTSAVSAWTTGRRVSVRSTLLPAIAWSAVVLVVTYFGLLLQGMRAGLVD